jgi:hypothetical protein
VIRVNVLYLSTEGARFDFDYYLQRHIPMVKDRLEPFGLTAVTVDRSVAGLVPGTPARHVYANYTNIQPVIDVAEVLM